MVGRKQQQTPNGEGDHSPEWKRGQIPRYSDEEGRCEAENTGCAQEKADERLECQKDGKGGQPKKTPEDSQGAAGSRWNPAAIAV